MEQSSIDSAQSYYNKDRKRSFFFSRISVIGSMIILLIVLGINMSVLYSQQRTSTTSHASTETDGQSLLPSLPRGCSYQKTNNTTSVRCNTPTPIPKIENTSLPVTINLPQLPSQCMYQTTNKGYKVSCTLTGTPIPTVIVSLPPGCADSQNKGENNIVCKDLSDKTSVYHLPNLPEGCVYQKTTSSYVVNCN